MDLKQIGSAVASFAPTIASMLAGPMAGQGVTMLEKVLGIDPGGGVEAISQKLQDAQLTNDQIVALREADAKHAEVLGQQGIDVNQINAAFEAGLAKTASEMLVTDAGDRSSARLRESNVRDLTPKLLAGLITIGFFGVMGAVAFAPMQPDAKEPILLLLGSLSTAWTAVVSYYFGSSSGAARGQELLAQSGPVHGNKPIEVSSK